ncbi:MAG TPA: tail fiber protein [Candidatus Microsaccharimonas sp.]|jgi:prepilin-type N-terminal cleavage/methylation domain-containing protein
MIKNKFRSAFTIVELIVVIAVIGILAGIVLVSYGAWRTSVATSSLKSDLVHAATAMESSRTFNNAYPITLPTTFTASSGNTIVLTLPDTKSFCIDGTTTQSASIKYYVDNLTQTNGATSGTCATRTSLPIPGVVANIAFTTGSTSIVVNWTLASPNYASQYLVQCAFDPGFITGLIQQTALGGTTITSTLNGANATTTYYCRVRAVNTNGQSDWSNTGSGDTQQHTCSDTQQYGTYPDCYDYDSMPAGTSIAGFWTSPPPGYILEDGSAISRTTYADLFAVIGTSMGAGDGTTTFNVPDSRGRVTVGLSSSDAEFNTIGETYGEKSHTITLNELPSHSHVQNVTANSGGSAVRIDYNTPENTSAAYPQGVNTNTAGGGAASNVIQPSIVQQYAIKWRPSTGTASTLPTGTTLQGYWATIPTGYLREDGLAVSRSSNSALFAVTSTTYGSGDGSTTFNVPNSMGRVGVNRNSSDTQFATMGLTYGEKTHLLTIGEMVAHSHVQIVTANSGGSAVRNDYTADGSGLQYTQTVTTGGAGGGQAFNVIQPSIAKKSTVKQAAPSGIVDDAGIVTGTSVEGWWTTAPTGFLLEDGTAVSRTTYSDLFALISTTYGSGDGSTTFNLPDSRGRVAVNRNTADATFLTIGAKMGEKTHIMTLSEMPVHSHAQYVTAANGGNPWRNDYKADAAGGGYAQNASTNATGGGAAYNVIQPSITKMFAIKY